MLSVSAVKPGAARVFHVFGGATDTISGLTITKSLFFGLVVADGGVRVDNGGTLTVNSCNITFNIGGISNDGTMTVTNCNISGNQTKGSGGGISNGGTMTVTNCTISDNGATEDGGILNGGTMTVTSCTISGNAVGAGVGGIGNLGTLTLQNTIVAGNLVANQFGGPSDIGGYNVTPNSSYNLVGTGGSGGLTNGINHNLVGVANPALGALANNGGPTQTMALLAGSPAINAGSNALVPAGITTDQRGPGFPRIRGGTVDIGAFESSAPPTITAFTVPATGAEGSRVNLSAAVNNDPDARVTYTWTVTAPPGAGSNLTLTGPTVSFTPPDQGDSGVSLTVSDGYGGTASRSASVAVANVPPTPALAGFTTDLATEVVTFTLSATDPSTTDVAGFTYSVNWADGSSVQTIAPTPGNGSGVHVTHVFTSAGTYNVALTATDEDGGATTITKTVTALAVTSANLQTVITQQGSITT